MRLWMWRDYQGVSARKDYTCGKHTHIDNASLLVQFRIIRPLPVSTDGILEFEQTTVIVSFGPY